MALSPIEDRYLSALTAAQFPDMPVAETQQPVADATQFDGMQLAAAPTQVVSDAGGGRGSYAGFDPRLDMANKGQQDQMRAYDPTTRERIASFLQAGFEGLGMDRYKARQNAQTLIGGPSSNLPLDIGIADLLAGVSRVGLAATTPLYVEEGSRAIGRGVEAAKRGEYGTAALETGAGLLDVVPGVVGGVNVGRKLVEATKNLPVGMSTQAIGGIPTGAPSLTRSERSVVTSAAGRKPALRDTATKAIEDMHTNYPEADGWMPIEATNVEFKKSKTGNTIAEVEAGKIPYDFHTPPEGVPKEAWQATLSARVFDEVQAVVDRAKAGDQAAIAILEQASWYRSMRDRLRAEFGGIGDVFADVLGTTSAQTGVEQNFDNAVEILRRFSRGEYDKELRAYEDRLKSGLPVDSKTLTQMYKDGEFPLITKASGRRPWERCLTYSAQSKLVIRQRRPTSPVT